ncbi:hypothetical protein GCM10007301_14600 [Azorhizobium oxalatiphilum]|uniref:Uncharacterized protein n=1 Tax=Azorhizobium oxalatiphilum TaxID=980631 RepID=A0A917BU75_9HYPH|nr:hypothetical protein [Azorhizobium oxalatiphilum]GGF56037.1 hypothetical protein GCM10007301_14600 [Azorhizobium oxalatiphilum]
MQRILEIRAVHLAVLQSRPTRLSVVAIGEVPTSGWKAPLLEPWFYIAPPEDGIQDFDFTAAPPFGIALEVVTPITAEILLERAPESYWGEGRPLKGVRVHARANVLEVPFEAPAEPQEPQVMDGPRWASPVNSGVISATDPISSLIGRELRVYHPGDALAFDWRQDRVNLQIDPGSRQIRAIAFG